MKPFTYVRARDERSAYVAAQASGAEMVAGGTSQVDLMRLEVHAPETLVDIVTLPWASIDARPEGLRIGAMARNSDVAYDPRVRADYPVLSQALLSGASPQLRNMATVGGNLLQRTRCAYFRDVSVPECNKRKPGAGCAAQGGFTRMHAVLGGSDKCIAVNPSDMCVALAALDAVVQIEGPKGARSVKIVDFHTVPGDHPEIETVLQRGELIKSVVLPKAPFAARSVYLKVRDRASYAFALASAAVALDVSDGVVLSARIALGGVATKPWRCLEAEGALAGQRATTDSFKKAAALAMNGARPTKENRFKVELATRTIVRALQMAGGVA